MLTCGEDQQFKVWNISGIDLATTAPSMIGGGFSTGNVVWSCRFSSTNHVLVGIEANVNVKVYGPTFTNSLIRSYSTADSGKLNAVDFFYC
jgi:WD40 repeat protein